jgi:UDP-N-acetylglucosamine pyrophosphorylase
MLKKLWKKFGPNPLDRKLKKAAREGAKAVLILWNRGLGDIALGLYAIVHRVKEFLPSAKVTFLTRPSLQEGFELFPEVEFLIAPEWKRGEKVTIPDNVPHFDLTLEGVDPTHWVAWQRGKLVPKLTWKNQWDGLCERFCLPARCIAAHVSCETSYYFERNWPADRWNRLFSLLDEPIVLIGQKKEPLFSHPNIIDLRGETSLHEILSILKNRCRCLIAPDSGILAMTYYLNVPFALKVVSLWADPNHGILKQNVASPNPLLEHIPLISANQKDAALISVEEVVNAVEPALLKEQRKILRSPPQITSYPPVTEYQTPADAPFTGNVASLVLAGGQGSRLLAKVPKALVPITAIRQKTLLQLLCEKTGAASLAYKKPLSIALMTSPSNHGLIAAFLEKHAYFGLSPSQVDLFVQGTTPFLNDQEGWFFDSEGKLAKGPDGNGYAFKHLASAGIAKKWKEQGVEMVSVVPIDNPLADPFDPSLFAYHAGSGNEISVKSILRQNEEEKVGLLVYKNGKIVVQEYSEAPFPNPAPLAYIGLLCVSLPLIERVATTSLPLHLARKTFEGKNIWKFERFIFDLLPHSEKTGVLVYPRENIYAPLKNQSGLAFAQQALLNFDRRLYRELFGQPPPEGVFELDPQFYYMTPELKSACKSRSIPSEKYITP